MEILKALMEAAGWTIIHSLWQGAILYGLLLVFLISNRNLTSAFRHNLSFLALTGMFIWSLATFYTQYVTLLPKLEVWSVGYYGEFASGKVAPNSDTLTHKIEQFIPILVLVYAIGLLIQIGYLTSGYLKVKAARSNGLSDLPMNLYEKFNDLAARVVIRRKIRFYISSIVSVPQMIGYFKPVVLLPLSAITSLSTEQLEAIIIHELSHIRRNDYLLNMIKLFIETILFFNPFVRLAARNIDKERENACDDLVLSLTGNSLMYVETLYHLQQLKMDQEQSFVLAATGKNYQLLARMERIMKADKPVVHTRHLAFAVFIFLGSIVSVSWLNPQIKEGKLTSENGKKVINNLASITKSRVDDKVVLSKLLKVVANNIANITQAEDESIEINNDSVSAISGLTRLGKRPLVLIDGKEYDPSILYKISGKSIRNMSLWAARETTVEKYGEKAKEGAVDITSTGKISYMNETEKENLRIERAAPQNQFITRLNLKRDDGSMFDRVIVRNATNTGSASSELSHNGKVAFFIDGKVYGENELSELGKEKLEEIKNANIRGVGPASIYDVPGADLSPYEKLFHFNTSPPIKVSYRYGDTQSMPANFLPAKKEAESSLDKMIEGKVISTGLRPDELSLLKEKLGAEVNNATGTVKGQELSKILLDREQARSPKSDPADNRIEIKVSPRTPLKEVQIVPRHTDSN